MILAWLIIILLAGGLLAWLLSRRNALWPRYISLIALSADFILALVLWVRHFGQARLSSESPWLAEMNREWIPQLGIGFRLAMDGLSLLLVLLTLFLGMAAVVASWTEVRERVGFFHFNLMWILAGIVGVFLSLDLFLFYFFWELMLVPMYFLIGIWGHENRIYAAIKFFIFTQAGGLLMLAAILGLYFIHGRNTGAYTFDYSQLLGTAMNPQTAMLLMLGFFIAFAVKLPVVPVHTWLPDAHTEAPTAGSVILAGLLLKTGAYGLMRFAVPLFPQAALDFAPVAMALGVIGILYGAILAFAQTDLKRLVAYTSISHMGFVLLGVFAANDLALQGAVIQILCHGISTGALFILAGALQERIHTRDMNRMGGFWAIAPRMGAVTLFFALASLGLPGLGNFVGEFLVLIGSYRVSVPLTVLATTGLVIATVYSLWIIQRVFHGPREQDLAFSDLSVREMAVMSVMIIAIVWLGLFPQPVLNTAEPFLKSLKQSASMMRVPDPAGEQGTASKHSRKNNPPLYGVGADLCVCPGFSERAITGADTQVCPYGKHRKIFASLSERAITGADTQVCPYGKHRKIFASLLSSGLYRRDLMMVTRSSRSDHGGMP
jgi:NADH-quinone oxidoreductase subunit M